MAKDIIIDGDITITADGDIKVGESDAQNIEFILQASPGQFYQYPTIGYDPVRLLNSNINLSKEKKIIKSNLEKDNYRVISIDLEKNTDDYDIEINAEKIK